MAMLTGASPRSVQQALRARLGPLTLDAERRQAIVFGRAVALTRLEFDLLAALMEAPGRTFSRDELMARLHAVDARTPTDRALDTLVVRLRRKLRDNPRRPKLVQSVWGVGYRLLAPSIETSLELAAQAIDLLPLPAFLIHRDRRIAASNAAGQRLWGRMPERLPCFEVFQCRAGNRPLRDHCCGLEAMVHRVPVARDYTITTPSGPAPMHAVYLPLVVGHAAMCLLVLAPAGPSGAG